MCRNEILSKCFFKSRDCDRDSNIIDIEGCMIRARNIIRQVKCEVSESDDLCLDYHNYVSIR